MSAIKDLLGRRFGSLVVIGPSVSKYNKAHWLCRCDCGKEKSICGVSLTSGASSACGCGKSKFNKSRSTHGLSRTIEHKTWQWIIHRCENPKAAVYKNYGGRGIKICARWRGSFAAFLEDMGPRPSSRHSIDRKDCNGDYEPDNCAWIDRRAQAENMRRSRFWQVDGVSYNSSTEAARSLGVSISCVMRWCNGYRNRGKWFPPRPGCLSYAKYEVQS